MRGDLLEVVHVPYPDAGSCCARVPGDAVESVTMIDMRRMLEEDAASYGLLADPRRRRVYLAVRQAGEALTKDDVATSLGISGTLAAFHLEKLLEGGFLEAHFAHPRTRRGRAMGRRAKHYAPSGREVAVRIPERRYEVVADILQRAIGTADATVSARQRALELAEDKGREVGEQFLAEAGRRRRGGVSQGAVARLVGELGYEPRTADGHILLGNCPFHALVSPPYFVCELNERLLQGVLGGCQARGLEPVHDYREGHCCVVLRPVRN